MCPKDFNTSTQISYSPLNLLYPNLQCKCGYYTIYSVKCYKQAFLLESRMASEI